MSILIKGLNMPKDKDEGVLIALYNDTDKAYILSTKETKEVIELHNHGDLIDINELSNAMYHEAFETDSKMQKWESGCWIRYKMFERLRDSAPVIIPADGGEE